jgi:hypothetical protein
MCASHLLRTGRVSVVIRRLVHHSWDEPAAFCDDTEFLDRAGGFDLKRLTALHMGWIWISASMLGLIPRFLVIRVS